MLHSRESNNFLTRCLQTSFASTATSLSLSLILYFLSACSRVWSCAHFLSHSVRREGWGGGSFDVWLLEKCVCVAGWKLLLLQSVIFHFFFALLFSARDEIVYFFSLVFLLLVLLLIYAAADCWQFWYSSFFFLHKFPMHWKNQKMIAGNSRQFELEIQLAQAKGAPKNWERKVSIDYYKYIAIGARSKWLPDSSMTMTGGEGEENRSRSNHGKSRCINLWKSGKINTKLGKNNLRFCLLYTR